MQMLIKKYLSSAKKHEIAYCIANGAHSGIECSQLLTSLEYCIWAPFGIIENLWLEKHDLFLDCDTIHRNIYNKLARNTMVMEIKYKNVHIYSKWFDKNGLIRKR